MQQSPKLGHRLNPLRERSPGEIAFDRCVRLLIILAVLPATLEKLNEVMRRKFGHVVLSLWSHQFSLLLPPVLPVAILLVVVWVWALRSVVNSWSDPVARVLRVGSVILLFGQFVFLALFLLGLSKAALAGTYWIWMGST